LDTPSWRVGKFVCEAAQAGKAATATPIVFVIGADPVRVGVVKSRAGCRAVKTAHSGRGFDGEHGTLAMGGCAGNACCYVDRGCAITTSCMARQWRTTFPCDTTNYIVEEDIGDETVDACIDAGRLLPMYIAVRGNDIGQDLQIGEPSCVGGIGGIAADALEVIALEIEFLRLA
jgi:hypothetical protein